MNARSTAGLCRMQGSCTCSYILFSQDCHAAGVLKYDSVTAHRDVVGLLEGERG